MTIKTWNIEAMCGYHPITTFYEDFSIADGFGERAIRDTYKRCMKSWRTDYKYLTELVMALNWKIWEHFDGGNPSYQKTYHELYEKAYDYALENLKGDELSYFFRTTD